MEKQQQQYLWWGIGAIVVIAVLWFVYGNSQKNAPTAAVSNTPVIVSPRQPAAGLAGEIIAGAVLPREGEYAVLGQNIQQAIQLAVEDINAERGIGGKKLVFAYQDGGCDTTKGSEAAKTLVTESKVQAIIGGACAEETAGVVSVVNGGSTIVFAPTGVADEVANASGHLFRFVPPTASLGNAAGAYAAETLKAKRAAIVSVDSVEGKELADAFSVGFEKSGGTVVFHILSWSDVANPAPMPSDVDVVYVVSSSVLQLAQIMEYLKIQNVTVPIITTDSVIASWIDQAKKDVVEGLAAIEGVTAIAPFYDVQSERVMQFAKLYKARFGEDPAYPLYAANAYSQTYLLRDLIEKDGYDGAKMQKTLQAPLTGWAGGAFGKVDLDKMGDTLQRTFAAWKVEGGALVSKGAIQTQ
ncbi:ABC transporter substrate-binding protein [Patescibacteria group bacterium]|nr:ABC transporter substrate-binding protein [Patescibacteria group bacterium]